MSTITKIERKDCEWIYILKPDSKLNARDIAQLLQISQYTLYCRIKSGSFPKNDSNRGVGRYKSIHLWSASNVIKGMQKYII